MERRRRFSDFKESYIRPTSASDSHDEKTCCICLEAFDQNEHKAIRIRLPDCRHVFCKACLEELFSRRTQQIGVNRCPKCRALWFDSLVPDYGSLVPDNGSLVTDDGSSSDDEFGRVRTEPGSYYREFEGIYTRMPTPESWRAQSEPGSISPNLRPTFLEPLSFEDVLQRNRILRLQIPSLRRLAGQDSIQAPASTSNTATESHIGPVSDAFSLASEAFSLASHPLPDSLNLHPPLRYFVQANRRSSPPQTEAPSQRSPTAPPILPSDRSSPLMASPHSPIPRQGLELESEPIPPSPSPLPPSPSPILPSVRSSPSMDSPPSPTSRQGLELESEPLVRPSPTYQQIRPRSESMLQQFSESVLQQEQANSRRAEQLDALETAITNASMQRRTALIETRLRLDQREMELVRRENQLVARRRELNARELSLDARELRLLPRESRVQRQEAEIRERTSRGERPDRET